MANLANQVKGKLPDFLSVKLTLTSTLESLFVGLVLGLTILFLLGSSVFFLMFQDRIYPGVYIDNQSVTGLTITEAQSLLAANSNLPDEFTVTLSGDDVSIASSSTELGIHREWNDSIASAYQIGRAGPFFDRLVTTISTFRSLNHLESNLKYDTQKVEQLVGLLSIEVDLEGQEPSANLRISGSPLSLSIDPGEYGRQLNIEETIDIVNNSSALQLTVLEATVASTSSQLNESEIVLAKERAAEFVGKEIIFTADDIRLKLTDKKIISLLAFPSGIFQDEVDSLIAQWQEDVERPAQEPEFSYNPTTLNVEVFSPPLNGLKIDVEKTSNEISRLIAQIESKDQSQEEKRSSFDPEPDIKVDLPVTTTQPRRSLSETNDLGINELIGFGDSEYDHSIPNRIHNVALTSSKINNTIVAPGAEFSFNRTLGDVSNETGFRSAYVIKGGQTVLGDGGGVCQVSTTLFRSVLNAGLPVTKRLQHSYRVSYYELNSKPGIDATVYSGNIDLRFTNDTGDYILVSVDADSANLYMKVEIYGTSDGRTTEITDHEVWGYRPPLPTEYIPDPTLPTGQKKIIDWAVAGAKASFKNIVKDKDGNVIREEEYYSNYRPWSAKYLVGV